MSLPVFDEGARVAMVGDSITHNGIAVAYIQEYYRTHFPKRGVQLFNVGIGGDTAAGCLMRMDDVLAVKPTDAVVMFGVNDLGCWLYRPDKEVNEEARAERCRAHLDAILRLVGELCAAGVRVVLCSSVGRDELTPATEERWHLTEGATDALYLMYQRNLDALLGKIVGTVDYLTPMQSLQGELVALGGPSLFEDDRTHPNPLGQAMMARILLASQGLPVKLPTAELLASGWCERPLSPEGEAAWQAGVALRDLVWFRPSHQKATEGMTLDGRVAYYREEIAKIERRDDPDMCEYDRECLGRSYRFFVENAYREEEMRADYYEKTAALYR